MKLALFAALSLFSCFALADGNSSSQPLATDQADPYDYTQDLDIAKVVRISNADQCGPIKAKMEYVDSKGVMHKLEYTRLGDVCQKG